MRIRRRSRVERGGNGCSPLGDSLFPIGGEGRGEGAGQDANDPLTLTLSPKGERGSVITPPVLRLQQLDQCHSSTAFTLIELLLPRSRRQAMRTQRGSRVERGGNGCSPLGDSLSPIGGE